MNSRTKVVIIITEGKVIFNMNLRMKVDVTLLSFKELLLYCCCRHAAAAHFFFFRIVDEITDDRSEERDVTPGDVLGKATELKPGKGAYVAARNDFVYASIVGRTTTVSPPADSADQRPSVEVIGLKAHGAVPEPGSIVIARVTKVMAKIASADIMCVGPKSVREKFTGIIRRQDVRATEIDQVDMHASFRPGDTVRALVLSLGDARAYILSTAKNELGVVSADSTAGATMIPISWTEMQCPLTGQTEKRKVAKVGS